MHSSSRQHVRMYSHCRRLHRKHAREVLFLRESDAYTKTRLCGTERRANVRAIGIMFSRQTIVLVPEKACLALTHLDARRKVELVSSVGDLAKEVTGLEEQSKGGDDIWVQPAPLRSLCGACPQPV
jgi:hypothetical protein